MCGLMSDLVICKLEKVWLYMTLISSILRQAIKQHKPNPTQPNHILLPSCLRPIPWAYAAAVVLHL